MWALTIAGGKGERLRPLTDDTCKPMVDVAGEPLLAHQVRWLVQQGVRDVVFLTGYHAEDIRHYFGDGGAHGMRAHYSHEESPLGRGGGVKQGLATLPADVDEVVVVNGDVLTDQALAPLLDLRRARDSTASLMLTPYFSEYGVVEMDTDGVVQAFREKVRLPYWVNAGVYVMHRRIHRLLPDLGDHETSTLPELAASGELVAMESEARWVSVDSPKDLRDAELLVGR